MNFNSFQFLIFLPTVLLLYWLLPHKVRWVLLLSASYYFYMSWNAWFIFAILGTTLVSYGAGIFIERAQNVKIKKMLLSVAVIICLGTLIFFKYFNFLLQNAIDFLNLFSLNLQSCTLDLILPVGISFYTFQTLSYVIDVYRGNFKAEKHFGYYALFVSYFPQLVAGPIEKPGDLLPQLKAEHKLNQDDMLCGFKILLCGFFMKCVVADYCGIFVNNVFNNLQNATGPSVFIACFLFSAQMFCDFAGYSNIAIGSARMMGVKLTKNFDKPYLALSFSDFARRWHITLNRWFTEYLYIPLGGGRKGKARKIFNTLIVFILSGLWHGANWTYLLWGLYTGIMICIESILKKPVSNLIQSKNIDVNKKWVLLLRHVVMHLMFIPASLLFRSQSLSQIGVAFSRIGVWGLNQTLSVLNVGFFEALCLTLCLMCMFMISDFTENSEHGGAQQQILNKKFYAEGSYVQHLSIYIYAIIAIMLFWLALLATGDASAFQYFQF